jgi:NADPH:quinone reductase-like Zn-dependent oxidoreductase
MEFSDFREPREPPMTTRMRAVSQRVFGGPEVLEVVEVDRPEPGPGEVLVRVHAAGVNPADWKIRSGFLPRFGEPPFTLGCDVSGVVEEVGAQVGSFQAGDEVFGLLLSRARLRRVRGACGGGAGDDPAEPESHAVGRVAGRGPHRMAGPRPASFTRVSAS